MPDVQWDNDASLMRVTNFETTPDNVEELIARGTVHDLVGVFLKMPLNRQRGLLLRAAGSDWTQEFDSSAIRELAALEAAESDQRVRRPRPEVRLHVDAAGDRYVGTGA